MTTRIPVLSSRWTWPRQRGSFRRGTSHERLLHAGRRRVHALPASRSPDRSHRGRCPGRSGCVRRSGPRPPRPGRRRAGGAARRPGRRRSRRAGRRPRGWSPRSPTGIRRRSRWRRRGRWRRARGPRGRADGTRRSRGRRGAVRVRRRRCRAVRRRRRGSTGVGASGPSPRTASRRAPRTRSASSAPPRQASTPAGGGAERVGPVDPAAGPVDGGVAAHPLEGGDGGLGDGRGSRRPRRPRSGRGRRGRRDVGEVVQGGAAGAVGAAAGGLDDLGPVLGAGDGGEAAGGGDMERGCRVRGPAGPSRRRPGRSSRGGARWGASGAASGRRSPASWAARTRAPTASRGILGPQPPGPWLEGVAYGGGQFGLALRGRPGSGRGRARRGRAGRRRRRAGRARRGPRPSWRRVAAYRRSRARASRLP